MIRYEHIILYKHAVDVQILTYGIKTVQNITSYVYLENLVYNYFIDV